MTIRELLKYYREECVCIWLNDGRKLNYERGFFDDFESIVPSDILDLKICGFGIKDDFCINIWEY